MRATVRTEGLNIHARPDGVIVDQLKRGDRVRVRNDPSPTATVTWWCVELIGDRVANGWVDGRALNFEKDEPAKLPPPPPYNPHWPTDVQPHAPDVIPEPLFPDWVAPVAGAAIGVVVLVILYWLVK